MSVQVPGVSWELVFWFETQHALDPSTPHSAVVMHWQTSLPGVTHAPVASWRWQQPDVHSEEVAHDCCGHASHTKVLRLQHAALALPTQSAFDWHPRSHTEVPSQLRSPVHWSSIAVGLTW